ncbi:serine/threonine protein kinase, partial [Fischerella thermalis CCMEE 5196]
EIDEIANMNFIAGCRALASTAYATAMKYLTTGIELLKDDSWKRKYELTLSLYETAAEVAYLLGDFEQTEQLVQIVLAKAKTLLEKVKVYEVMIKAYGAKNQALKAVKTALIILKQLGVEFPENPTQSDVQLAMAEITSNLNGRPIEDLVDLPEMKEDKPLAVMRILSTVSSYAYLSAPELYPLICFRQIHLSLKYGNTLFSTCVYVNYGLFLCGVIGDIESGYQFGKLGTNLLTKFNAKEVKAKTIGSFNIIIRHWKEHASKILKPILEAYFVGLETGDLEYSAYTLNAYCYYSYFIGKELTELKQEIANYSKAIAEINQKIVFHWNEIYHQSVLNLLESGENTYRLSGESYDEENMLPIHLQNNDVMGLLFLFF